MNENHISRLKIDDIEEEEELSSESDDNREPAVVPGLKSYSGAVSNQETVDQQTRPPNNAASGYVTGSTVLGSLRYHANNPLTRENSPDELGQTVPLDYIPELIPPQSSRTPSSQPTSYVTKEGRKVMIISTSMTGGINDANFNEKVIGAKVKFQRFRGGHAEYMKQYIVPHLMKEKPDECIVQAGGNDLPNNNNKNKPNAVSVIANHIIDIGHVCRRYGARKVEVVEVMPRQQTYYQVKRKEINELLQNLCVVNNFGFIKIDNLVVSDHIWTDGVHLNKVGSNIFSEKLLNCINNTAQTNGVSTILEDISSRQIVSYRSEDCTVGNN